MNLLGSVFSRVKSAPITRRGRSPFFFIKYFYYCTLLYIALSRLNEDLVMTKTFNRKVYLCIARLMLS